MCLPSGSLKEVALNNFYYYVQQAMEQYGSVYTLVGLAVILVIMTGLKCGTSYLSTAKGKSTRTNRVNCQLNISIMPRQPMIIIGFLIIMSSDIIKEFCGV